MPEHDDRRGLELPARLELPFFAYGPLKPGQPAHGPLLSARMVASRPARAAGGLRARDGLPLLDPDGTVGVEGSLLTFATGVERDAYAAISAFAPRQHYRWLVVPVQAVDAAAAPANILVGRHPERGSADEWSSSWTAVDEPAFGFGLHPVRAMTLVHAAAPFTPLDGRDPSFWDRFFGMHAAFALLWSAVERFSALALGPAEPAAPRLYRLGDDPRFRECVIAAGVAPSPKTPDARDPQRSRRIRADGAGAMFSWEAVRSNLGHPGATAYADGIVLRRALVELHDTFRLLLLTHLPELATTWKGLDPAGADHRWLLRPVVSPEGLGP